MPPDQTIGICFDLLERPGPSCHEHVAEGPVGDDPGVVVDAAVALGLADDGDDAVGLDHALVEQPRQPGRVADALEHDLADLDRLWHWSHLSSPVGDTFAVSPAPPRSRPRRPPQR